MSVWSYVVCADRVPVVATLVLMINCGVLVGGGAESRTIIVVFCFFEVLVLDLTIPSRAGHQRKG